MGLGNRFCHVTVQKDINQLISISAQRIAAGRSKHPKLENADFARGWSEFADFAATLTDQAQARKR